MKQSPKQPAEKRQAQLIAAARKVFVKKGYSGTSMAEIAKSARLTKGSLYFHFKNKDDIFFAVVKSLTEEAMNPFYDIITSSKDADLSLKRLVEQSFSLIEEEKYVSPHIWHTAHKITKIGQYLSNEHNRIENAIAEHFARNSDLTKKESLYLVGMVHAFIDGVMLRQSFCCRYDESSSLKKPLIEMSRLYLHKKEFKLG